MPTRGIVVPRVDWSAWDRLMYTMISLASGVSASELSRRSSMSYPVRAPWSAHPRPWPASSFEDLSMKKNPSIIPSQTTTAWA